MLFNRSSGTVSTQLPKACEYGKVIKNLSANRTLPAPEVVHSKTWTQNKTNRINAPDACWTYWIFQPEASPQFPKFIIRNFAPPPSNYVGASRCQIPPTAPWAPLVHWCILLRAHVSPAILPSIFFDQANWTLTLGGFQTKKRPSVARIWRLGSYGGSSFL